MASQRWKAWGAVCAFLVYELYLFAWRLYVDPSPDFQYPEFFSNFNNYLILSQYLGNDVFRLIELGFDSDYPLGFALFPWLISGWGLQDIFLSDPWLLNIFFTAPLAFLPVLTNWSKGRCCFYWLMIFLFPGTQILLKGFNPQAPILVYTLCAFCCYFSYLREPGKDKLAAFFLLAWVAISIKHLGAFYFTIFFLTLFVWRFLRREKPWLEVRMAFLLGICCYPFYPIDGLIFYFSHVVTSHNPFFSLGEFFLILGLALFGGTFSLLLLRRFMGKEKMGRRFGVIWIPVAAVLFWQISIYVPLNPTQSMVAAAVCVLVTFLMGVFLILRFDFRCVPSLESFLVWNLLGYSSALYLSLVGHTSYIFLLPLMLMVWFCCSEVESYFRGMVLILGFGLMSQFFPTQKTISRILEDDQFYYRLFNTEGQNPLGWQKNHLAKARKELVQILEAYLYEMERYENGLSIGCLEVDLDVFGFYFDVQTYFPIPNSNKIFPDSIFKVHLGNIKRGNLQFFDKWHIGGWIPVLIAETPKGEESLDKLLRDEIEDLKNQADEGSEIWRFEKELLKIFILHLRMNKALQAYYEKHQFHFGDRVFDVYVHTSIPKRKLSPRGANYYLYQQIQMGR